MTPEQFQRVEELFHQALELDGGARTTLLDRECAGDIEIRAEVERLVNHREHADTLMGLGQGVSRLVGSVIEEQPGGSVGPYELIRCLGEGGMGVVYEARQSEPVERAVALKLIKWGMDTRQVVARFETERQSLARMSHPGIARVLDAGATEKGRPYFVMELVHGSPITDYCDERRLGIPERLRVFVRVCEAIQHAHQRGVIHRDVKPSNVLVETHDGRPLPKIIDFGIAKAISQRDTEHTIYTELGQLIGTPDYASPEQSGGGGEVDTRTDVYSLGVLLFELLVGARLFDAEGEDESLEILRRRICEEDAPLPSVRYRGMGERRPALAAARATEPRALDRALKGELDWIAMKALAKEPNRRYASASELAADVQRHLRHEPVLVGPPGAGYRLRKVIRRHRFAVLAAATLAIAVVIGTGLSLVGLVRARAEAVERAIEAETARQVSDFLVELFGTSDPGEARGDPMTTRELLDRGAQRIEAELGDRPRVQARLMHAIGTVYTNLGNYDEARELLTGAMKRRRRELGDTHAETLESTEALADAEWYAGRYDVAQEYYEELLEHYRRMQSPEAADSIRVLKALADTHWAAGRYDLAEQFYQESYEANLGAHGPEALATIECLNGIAILRAQAGRHDEAEPLFQQVLAARTRTLGGDHPATLKARTNLANLYNMLGQYAQAEQALRKNLEAQTRVMGAAHQDTLTTLDSLGTNYQYQGRLQEAKQTFQRAFEAHENALGPDHNRTIRVLANLGNLYVVLGDHREALSLHQQAAAAYERTQGPQHPWTLKARSRVADDYRSLGQLDRADPLLQEVLVAQRSVLEPSHGDIQNTLVILGKTCAERSDRAGMLRSFREAASMGWTHPDLLGDPALARFAEDPEALDLANAVLPHP